MARTVYRSFGLTTACAAALCCAARAAAQDRYGEFLEEASVMAPNAQEITAIPHDNGIVTNVEAPSTVHVDEVYLSKVSGTGFTLFYMERAETVRDPQGTLLGRNVHKDLVRYVPVKPSDGFDGYRRAVNGDQARDRAADVLLCDYLVLLGEPPCTPGRATDGRLGIEIPRFEWPLTGFGDDLTMPGSAEDRTEQLLSLTNPLTPNDDGHTPCPTSLADQRQEAIR